jgi:hypothetical protein
MLYSVTQNKQKTKKKGRGATSRAHKTYIPVAEISIVQHINCSVITSAVVLFYLIFSGGGGGDCPDFL